MLILNCIRMCYRILDCVMCVWLLENIVYSVPMKVILRDVQQLLSVFLVYNEYIYNEMKQKLN